MNAERPSKELGRFGWRDDQAFPSDGIEDRVLVVAGLPPRTDLFRALRRPPLSGSVDEGGGTSVATIG